MKNLNWVGIWGILFVGTSISGAIGGTDSLTDWKKIGNPDGIDVFKKDITDSPIVAFKGQGVVKAPIVRLASILLDTSRATEWVDRLEEIRLLRRVSDLEYITYTHIATPLLMTHRDFVIRNRLRVDPKQNVFTLNLSSTQDPRAPHTDYVRGEIMDSSFMLKPISETQTLVTAEIHTDPKGNVPKWAVNLFQKEWPYNTIQSLREQVQKPDITEAPQLQAYLSVLRQFVVAQNN